MNVKASLVLFFAALVSLTGNVRAQSSEEAEVLMGRLASESITERTQASQAIFGAGMSNKALYDQLAAILESGVVGLDKNSPRLEELAWHVKALAGSGDMTYMPLIDRLSNSSIRGLARHARDAKETLEESAARGHPYFHYSKVRVITEKQAENCKFISQRTCETSRSADKCIDSHKKNAVETGANAIMLLHSSSQSGGLAAIPFGGSTTMLANYYLCRQQ